MVKEWLKFELFCNFVTCTINPVTSSVLTSYKIIWLVLSPITFSYMYICNTSFISAIVFVSLCLNIYIYIERKTDRDREKERDRESKRESERERAIDIGREKQRKITNLQWLWVSCLTSFQTALIKTYFYRSVTFNWYSNNDTIQLIFEQCNEAIIKQ